MNLLQDLRYAFRQAVSARSFTATAVLTLALGIGVNAAIFSAVYALLLKSFPFRDIGSLTFIEETHPQAGVIQASYQDYLDWRGNANSFESLAAYSAVHHSNSQLLVDGKPQVVHVVLASANLFPTLGIRPVAGRVFLPSEDNDTGAHVAVLSHDLWVNRFGRDPHAIGRAVEIDGQSFIIVGVMPEAQRFPVDTDLWLPLSQMQPDERTNRQYHAVDVIGRLRPGVDRKQATLELTTLAGRLVQSYPATNRDIGVRVMGLRESLVGQLKPALLMLMVAACLVLLIACVNIANLLMVRATVREREIAIRLALGATRKRLVQQSVIESLVPATAGAMMGILLAVASMPMLRAGLQILNMKYLLSIQPISVSLPVLGCTALATALIGTGFGLVHAFRRTPDLNHGLRRYERGATGNSGTTKKVLAGGEIALAVMVVFAAILLLRSFQRLLEVDPGFRTDHLLAAKIDLPPNVYTSDEQLKRFSTQLQAAVVGLPGVTSAGTTNAEPLEPSRSLTRFEIDGEPAPAPGNFPVTQIRIVSPSYFSTLGIGLVSGRMLEAKDVDDPVGVYLVNEAFAHRFLQDRSAVGSRLMMNVLSKHPVATPVIGVVANAKDLGVGEAVAPVIYTAGYSNGQVLLVRTTADPVAIENSIRRIVSSLDPGQAVSSIRTIDEILSDSRARPKFSAWLLGFFALLSLTLAALGVYGVLSYTVAQRTREIGIRMALGAQKAQVVGVFLREGARVLIAGAVSGLIAALLLAQLLRNQLFETAANDPISAFASMAVLLSIGILAIYIPARRASKYEPIQALRSE